MPDWLLFTAELIIHHGGTEGTEKEYFFVCRETTANKEFTAFGKKNDILVNPAGTASLIPSSSPDGIRKIYPPCSPCLCGEAIIDKLLSVEFE